MFVFNGWVTLLAFIAPLINLVAHAQSNSPAGGYIAITGVQTGINTATGELPARKNILDLQNDEPAWYAKSLPKFYALPVTDICVTIGHCTYKLSMPCKLLMKMTRYLGSKSPVFTADLSFRGTTSISTKALNIIGGRAIVLTSAYFSLPGIDPI